MPEQWTRTLTFQQTGEFSLRILNGMQKPIDGIPAQCRKVGLVPATLSHIWGQAAQEAEVPQNAGRIQNRGYHPVVAVEDRQGAGLIQTNDQNRPDAGITIQASA